jgi:FGFR1 oncogene partner
MDDLKNIVIQSLEDEGTLGALRAQLRSRVFKAIEKHADAPTKQAAGFQWQNPVASKIHDNDESRLVAQLVREYLEYYRMEYTLSVYLPEVSMQNQEAPARDDLCRQAGINPPSSESSAPLLVHLLRQLKQGGSPAAPMFLYEPEKK